MYCPDKSSETLHFMLTEFGNNCHSSFIIEDLERKSWTHTHSIFMSLDYLNKSDSMHWIKR